MKNATTKVGTIPRERVELEKKFDKKSKKRRRKKKNRINNMRPEHRLWERRMKKETIQSINLQKRMNSLIDQK